MVGTGEAARKQGIVPLLHQGVSRERCTIKMSDQAKHQKGKLPNAGMNTEVVVRVTSFYRKGLPIMIHKQEHEGSEGADLQRKHIPV